MIWIASHCCLVTCWERFKYMQPLKEKWLSTWLILFCIVSQEAHWVVYQFVKGFMAVGISFTNANIHCWICSYLKKNTFYLLLDIILKHGVWNSSYHYIINYLSKRMTRQWCNLRLRECSWKTLKRSKFMWQWKQKRLNYYALSV